MKKIIQNSYKIFLSPKKGEKDYLSLPLVVFFVCFYVFRFLALTLKDEALYTFSASCLCVF